MGACGGSSCVRAARDTPMAKSRRRPGRGAACDGPRPSPGHFDGELELHEPLERQEPQRCEDGESSEQRRARIRREVAQVAADAEAPSAGFEIEFADAQIVRLDARPSGPTANLVDRLNHPENRALLKADWERKLRVETNLRKRRRVAMELIRQDLRDPSRYISFTKRDVCISAPHGTWHATTDTVGPFDSRLEIVTAPLTLEQWRHADAQADLALLDQLADAVRDAARNELVPLREIVGGIQDLVLHEPDAWIIVSSHVRHDFQMTRQVPLAAIHQNPPNDDLELRGVEVAQLLATIRAFSTTFRGNNPKEAFAELPKTPLHLMITFPQLEGSDRIEGWINAVAARANIEAELDDDPIQSMINRTSGAMKPQPAGFTWREFLRALVTGRGDRLAAWSRDAFSGEDFGYGTLGGATLLAGHGIFEQRHPETEGNRIPERIESLLRGWATDLAR